MEKEIKILLVVTLLIVCGSIIYPAYVADAGWKNVQHRQDMLIDSIVDTSDVDIRVNQTKNPSSNIIEFDKPIPVKAGKIYFIGIPGIILEVVRWDGNFPVFR